MQVQLTGLGSYYDYSDMALWIRPYGLTTKKVLSSSPLAEAVVPLGKALYPHLPIVPQKGLKAINDLVVHSKAPCFFSGQVK